MNSLLLMLFLAPLLGAAVVALVVTLAIAVAWFPRFLVAQRRARAIGGAVITG